MNFTWQSLAILGLICINYVNCMSESQIKNAVKLVRNVCQPKTKVTNVQIDNMHKGIFEDDNNQACYMSCGLHALKFMKNGKMDYDFAIKQIKALPVNWQEGVGNAIEGCKTAGTVSSMAHHCYIKAAFAISPDKCEASYQVAKCMYEVSPDTYFLP